MNSLAALTFYFSVALALWVIAPRTLYFSDELIVYPVSVDFCNDNNVCDVSAFHSKIRLRVDKQRSEVVWMSVDNGSFGVWENCAIANKENWRCEMSWQTVSMLNGKLENRSSTFRYIPGWSYRLYWLLDFLPLERSQS